MTANVVRRSEVTDDFNQAVVKTHKKKLLKKIVSLAFMVLIAIGFILVLSGIS